MKSEKGKVKSGGERAGEVRLDAGDEGTVFWGGGAIRAFAGWGDLVAWGTMKRLWKGLVCGFAAAGVDGCRQDSNGA